MEKEFQKIVTALRKLMEREINGPNRINLGLHLAEIGRACSSAAAAIGFREAQLDSIAIGIANNTPAEDDIPVEYLDDLYNTDDDGNYRFE